jgi:SAM-dependent methyltransferase
MQHLEAIKDYWTMRVDGYSSSILDELRSGKADHWLNIINGYLISIGTLDVLDIGTGPGFFPIIMGKVGHRVTAIDYTDAMLDMARVNCAEYGILANFQRMDAQTLSFPDGSFDLILSRNLVWNLERPRQAYREWLRVLRPGGRIIVFDGNHYLHLYDQDYENEWRKKEESEHRFLKGVDTNIIKGIARDLPLSRERRPQWDVNTFVELGARLVFADTRGVDVYHKRMGDEVISLPFSFVVIAEK